MKIPKITIGDFMALSEPSIVHNKEFIKELVKLNPNNIKYAPSNLRNDADIKALGEVNHEPSK